MYKLQGIYCIGMVKIRVVVNVVKNNSSADLGLTITVFNLFQGVVWVWCCNFANYKRGDTYFYH